MPRCRLIVGPFGPRPSVVFSGVFLGLTLALLPTAPSRAVAGPPSARVASGTRADASLAGPLDWPTYGHDSQHSFHGLTSLTESSAAHLQKAWFFPTGDAVTATPIVVGPTVYVGSWDGYFYALDFRTGALRWRYRLNPQPAVRPYPGEMPRDNTSDGGLVTSSAWFERAGPGHPNLIIFGGGYTIYALNARSGALFWSHQYTGRPELPADPMNDSTRIFSSPIVSEGKVIFGVSADGDPGRRGYIVAASLLSGDPEWEFQTDVNSQGQVLNDGCGGIWSSATLLPRQALVVFDTADCDDSNNAPLSESVLALAVGSGQLVWQYRPPRVDPNCDLDFGATVNAGVNPQGQVLFLGVGGKDGTYYSLDPGTGQLRWSTNVVFGGGAGGFIGTSAYDGTRIYGSTALGDFPPPVCDPRNPADTPFQEPTVHAFDASSGHVVWQQTGGGSFAPTTVAGGMTFNSLALKPELQVRDAPTGALVDQVPLPIPSWSGIATVGNAIVLGTGTSYAGTPAGVTVLTPDGAAPVVADAPFTS
jgi:outer membrane protein assembly factor BamB